MIETEPLDPLHAECLQVRAEIRWWFARARVRAAAWQPRPMPPGWRR